MSDELRPPAGGPPPRNAPPGKPRPPGKKANPPRPAAPAPGGGRPPEKPRPPGKTAKPAAAVAEAVGRSYGNVTRAARRLGSDRRTLTRRIAKDPALRAAVADARERLVDLAESALVRALTSADPPGWAVIWTLKTMGRDRGWAESPPPGAVPPVLPPRTDDPALAFDPPPAGHPGTDAAFDPPPAPDPA